MTNPRTEGRYLTDESYVLERAPVQPKLRYPEEIYAERIKELETALKVCIDQLDKTQADRSKAWDHAADYQKRLFKALIALRGLMDVAEEFGMAQLYRADPRMITARAALGDKQ